VNSISTLIMQRPENKIASTKPGYSFQYWLFRFDETESAWIETISSEYVEVTEEMLDKWITLDLEKDGESEFLEPGQYIASIQVYHGGGAGANNSQYRFTIGSDTDHKQSLGKSVYRLITDTENSWSANRDVSMIRMNINESGAPTSADVTFTVDMTLPIANGYFNPAGGDFLDIAGSFNGWDGASHRLTDTDGDGIYTITVPAVGTFEVIEYKYRINGNWNTSEFPSGGPNRVYRTSYYNMIHDIYNNGISMGTDLNALTSSMNVFPNPTTGEFFLSVTNTQVSDINILISNIQGQVVYEKTIKSVLSHQEKINLSDLSKGVYFLKMNDRVTKVLVQ